MRLSTVPFVLPKPEFQGEKGYQETSGCVARENLLRSKKISTSGGDHDQLDVY